MACNKLFHGDHFSTHFKKDYKQLFHKTHHLTNVHINIFYSRLRFAHCVGTIPLPVGCKMISLYAYKLNALTHLSPRFQHVLSERLRLSA